MSNLGWRDLIRFGISLFLISLGDIFGGVVLSGEPPNHQVNVILAAMLTVLMAVREGKT